MNYQIDLTIGFSPLDHISEKLTFTNSEDAGGNLAFELDEVIEFRREDVVLITTKFKDFRDFGHIAMAVNAVRSSGAKAVMLFMPYIPMGEGAKTGEGVGKPAMIVSDFLNSLRLDVVLTEDASEIYESTINNIRSIDNTDFVVQALEEMESFTSEPVAVLHYEGEESFLQLAAKCRANIKPNTPILVVAKVCNSGSILVKMLTNSICNNPDRVVCLAATHGIFSREFSQLSTVFKKIYTTDSFDGQRGELTEELSY